MAMKSKVLDRAQKYLESMERNDLIELGSTLFVCRDKKRMLKDWEVEVPECVCCARVDEIFEKVLRGETKNTLVDTIYSEASSKMLREMANRYDEG